MADTMEQDAPTWDLADRLRKAREIAGFHQSDMAELIGLGRTTIGNYESRVSTPKRPVLLSWALATGVSLDWLLGGSAHCPQCGETGESRSRCCCASALVSAVTGQQALPLAI